MTLSAFDDKSEPPKDDDLAIMLGSTFVFWNELKRLIASRFTPLSIEWGLPASRLGGDYNSSGKKRTILYMIPCEGYFVASFALGEQAAKAVYEIDLPISVLEAIDAAKKYAEGRGVRLEVRSAEDVRNVA